MGRQNLRVSWCNLWRIQLQYKYYPRGHCKPVSVVSSGSKPYLARTGMAYVRRRRTQLWSRRAHLLTHRARTTHSRGSGGEMGRWRHRQCRRISCERRMGARRPWWHAAHIFLCTANAWHGTAPVSFLSLECAGKAGLYAVACRQERVYVRTRTVAHL